MRRVIVECGCSKVISTQDYEDDKPFSTVYVAGECAECTANNGQYNKSSHWVSDKPTYEPMKAIPDMSNVKPIKTKADKKRARK